MNKQQSNHHQQVALKGSLAKLEYAEPPSTGQTLSSLQSS